MDKTILIERTSKRLKRWELIVTAALFLTLLAGFGTLYILGDTKIKRTKSLLCEIFEHRGNKENSKWSERAA